MCHNGPEPCCSQLTALRLSQALGQNGNGDAAALAEALPQLRALELKDSAQGATDAGLHGKVPCLVLSVLLTPALMLPHEARTSKRLPHSL